MLVTTSCVLVTVLVTVRHSRLCVDGVLFVSCVVVSAACIVAFACLLAVAVTASGAPHRAAVHHDQHIGRGHCHIPALAAHPHGVANSGPVHGAAMHAASQSLLPGSAAAAADVQAGAAPAAVLKQYNRMAKQQLQEGLQLVDLSEQSVSLQATLSINSANQQAASSHTSPSPQSGAATTAEASVQQPGCCNQDASSSEEPQQLQQQQQDEGAADAYVLEELLQRHVHDSLDLMKVTALGVYNTLNIWQMAQYFIACWPYFTNPLPLVELLPFLVPDDSQPLAINASISEDAAKAAALAEEVGYLSAHSFMQRRQEGLEAQLHWALQLP